MRKDVYERMKYFVVEKIKPNYSAIARQYDVDPRTVKTAYLRAQNGETIVRNQRRRRSKLMDFKTSLKINTPQGVLLEQFMILSLKKVLQVNTPSLKIIVAIFAKHKLRKPRLELNIRWD